MRPKAERRPDIKTKWATRPRVAREHATVLEETERKQIVALEESGWVVSRPKGAAAQMTMKVRIHKHAISHDSKLA